MRLYELTNQFYVATSIVGFGCSSYLLLFDGSGRGILRTILMLGWTAFSGITVVKMVGELIIERMIKRNVLGGIKKKLLTKLHEMVNNKLVTALYLMLMFGMIIVKIGVPFVINGLSIG